MTTEFFGLRLNEQYTPIDAIDILRNNTGKTFVIQEGTPLRIVGHDIDFAGYSWREVLFKFDYTNHLHQVFFDKWFYSLGQRVDTQTFHQAREESMACFRSLVNMLEGKYGKADLDYSRTGMMSWHFGKSQSLSIQISSVNYHYFNFDESGWLPQYSESLMYFDNQANASSSDML